MSNQADISALLPAPVWTTSSHTIPSAERTNSASKVEEIDNSSPSGPNTQNLPPNYYNISIVPNQAVLHYNEMNPHSEPSRAQIKRQIEGILSLDPLIENDPDQLWLYFKTYLNERPSLTMTIHGYRIERYTTSERIRSRNGHYQTRTVHRTRHVTDFRFSFDLTNYISSHWWRVATIPSKKIMKADAHVSPRHVIEQYTHSDKTMKTIVCRKQLIGWDFQGLTHKIKAIIRSIGYPNRIDVSFSVKNNRISARSSSAISRFSDSTLVRLLCLASCLCLIFGPFYLFLRKVGSMQDQLVADYTMLTSADAFLQRHTATIVNAVTKRSTEHYVAYLA